MKTWLKGGLFGALIAFLLIVIEEIFDLNFLSTSIFSRIISPLTDTIVIIIFKILGISSSGYGGIFISSILSIIVFIVGFFILGALIGLIIQKIKSQ